MRWPLTLEELERAEPVYEVFPGWAEDISGARTHGRPAARRGGLRGGRRGAGRGARGRRQRRPGAHPDDHARGPAAEAPGPAHDRPLHAARDGRSCGRSRAASSTCSAWSWPSSRVLAERGDVPAAAVAAIARPRPRGRRPHRRAGAHDRPRRRGLRHAGRRVGRRGGPLPPPRAHQQRRRGHRAWPCSAGPPPTSSWPASTLPSRPSWRAPGSTPTR